MTAMKQFSEQVHQESIQTRLQSRKNGFRHFALAGPAPIATLFVRQAELHTQKLAIVDSEEALTFAALERRANDIGCAVRDTISQGPKVVPVLIRRRTAFIAAVLGILRAGGFYVPVDPSFPESNNARILREGGAGVVLTDTGGRGAAERLLPQNCTLLCV